jgi:hypothetical protein
LPYQYAGSPAPEPKLFVVVCHEKRDGVMYCVCIKATSKTEVYDNDSEQMKGAVCYQAGEACFAVRTVIQPDNPLPISHQDIVKHNRARAFAVVGDLPADFQAKLVAAIRASATMSPAWKHNMLAKIGQA